MRAVAAVGINDNLAACKTAVALRAANYESTGWIDEELRAFQPIFRHHRANDFFDDGFRKFGFHAGAVGHFRGMLRADNDCVSTDGFAVAVAQRYLTLSVGPKERQRAVLTHDALTFHQAVCVVNRSGHQRGRFRAGIAEHQTLVAGAEIELVIHRVINALGNVLRLLVVADEN